MKLGRWSTTAGSNNNTPPDGWPEGQAPSTVNDCAREMMASIRAVFNDVVYFDQDLTPTFVNATTFTVPGNQTSALHAGRRLKLFDATAGVATTIYATIVTASFTAATTIQVANDAGNLTSSLSSFAVSIIPQQNSPVPNLVDFDRMSASAVETTTLSVSGDTTIKGNLTVSGQAHIGQLSVAGAVALGSTMTVSGALAALSTLSVSGAASIKGNTFVGGNLTISGQLHVGAMSLGGALAVGSTMTVSGAAAVLGAMSISGVLTLGVGQIAFPAVQNSDAGANVLDDYEEGTFTPNITIGGGTQSITYAANGQIGRYTKVGNLVAFQMYIKLASKGTSAGSVLLGGLPFTALNVLNTNYSYPLYATQLTDVQAVIAFMGNGSTQMLPRELSGSNGYAGTQLQNTNLTDSAEFCVSGIYFTAT